MYYHQLSTNPTKGEDDSVYEFNHRDVYSKLFDQEMSKSAFIRCESFFDIEPGYKVIILQNLEHKPIRLLNGRFKELTSKFAIVEIEVIGFYKILFKKRIVKIPISDTTNFQIYASSGDFNDWNKILKLFSES